MHSCVSSFNSYLAVLGRRATPWYPKAPLVSVTLLVEGGDRVWAVDELVAVADTPSRWRRHPVGEPVVPDDPGFPRPVGPSGHQQDVGERVQVKVVGDGIVLHGEGGLPGEAAGQHVAVQLRCAVRHPRGVGERQAGGNNSFFATTSKEFIFVSAVPVSASDVRVPVRLDLGLPVNHSTDHHAVLPHVKVVGQPESNVVAVDRVGRHSTLKDEFIEVLIQSPVRKIMKKANVFLVNISLLPELLL